jgi:hypothetical protein
MMLATSGLEARSDSSGRVFSGKGFRFRSCCVAEVVRLWVLSPFGVPFNCDCDAAWWRRGFCAGPFDRVARICL